MYHEATPFPSDMNASQYIRLMIVDDHHIFAEALSFALDGEEGIQVIATAAKPSEALVKLEQTSPPIDVILMDIRMGNDEMNGIEASGLIGKKYPATAIVILSMHNKGEYISQALKQNVSAYLLKESHAAEVIKAIHAVHRGEKYFSDEVRETLTNYQINLQPIKLTRREKEVLKLIVEGLSTTEISAQLFIGEAGVETHRRNLRNKFGVKNTASLVREAMRRNFVE